MKPLQIQFNVIPKTHQRFQTENWPSAGGKTPPNECSGYDTKQSDNEVTVMLELWGMRNTPLLSLLTSPPWPGMVEADRALSMS